MSELLSVRDVVKVFGHVRAVDGVSFSVRRGTITGLLGRNGAGKTTTIRMITGIFHPDSGSIEWRGSGDGSSFRDGIGYLPEERGLYKQMKVVELLLFLAEIKGKKPSEVRPRIDGWLERFELTDKRDAKVEELSKGNQQKVQLIGALLHDPELIILDEPQTGLDPVNQVLVRNLLRELRNEGKTILLSTHMMGEAEKLADEIVLIHRGKVVLEGSLDQVRGSFGRNTLHIDYDGDGAFLERIPEVRRAMIAGNAAELSLSDGADPQRILEAAMGRLRIRRFEIGAPSLEEIFIDKVGAETLEAEGVRR
ncbi:MAG TPA: ATP-binding cassette domain-containing protein [Thermoanaerobaculia bacterium]|nr:ATP-binding cassette domain-containing protein [Thermoanaerobaculia bacterium]